MRFEDLLHERGLATAVGDEGGFAPDLGSSEEAIDVVLEAAERAGHRDRVALALDPAATELWQDGRYRFEGREADPDEMSVDLGGPRARPTPSSRSRTVLPRTSGSPGGKLTDRIGSRVQLVGDDLFVTNVARLQRGIEEGSRTRSSSR